MRIAKKLRLEQNFNGYIHLKAIPGASEELMKEAGLYADRLSVNVEMPTAKSLKLLAPDKNHQDVIPIYQNTMCKRILRIFKKKSTSGMN